MLRNDKVNYNREIVREDIDKHILGITEYENTSPKFFESWLNNIKNIKGVKIEAVIRAKYYNRGGCDSDYDNVIYLIPYIEREENDKEYDKRIKEEEQEYKELEEQRRLIEASRKEYAKDLAEYERIKNKYHLL